MVSIAFLSGEGLASLLFGQRDISRSQALVYALAGVTSIATGLLNWSILSPKKTMGNEKAKVWIGMLHSKLVLTVLLLTPLFEKLTNIQISISTKAAGIILMISMASYMRFYREDAQLEHQKQI